MVNTKKTQEKHKIVFWNFNARSF